MMFKKIITTIFAVITFSAAIPAAEIAADTSVVSISASAAYESYSKAQAQQDLQTVQNHWTWLGYYRSYNTKSAVRAMQRLLNNLDGANLSVDGVYGPGTRSAVYSFQAKYGLSYDVSFGNQCKNKMAELVSAYNPGQSAKLDFSAAWNYAKTYWNRRNYSYNYYNGNNCVNFVSQCLVSAGYKTNSSFCNGSYAFVNCSGFRNYFQNQGVNYIYRPSSSQIEPGDVIFTNNNGHAMFVMSVKNGVIYASGNTNNRDCLGLYSSSITSVIKTSDLF